MIHSCFNSDVIPANFECTRQKIIIDLKRRCFELQIGQSKRETIMNLIVDGVPWDLGEVVVDVAGNDGTIKATGICTETF